MDKLKSFGSCLGTFLISSLIIVVIGNGIIYLFPNTSGVVSTIGGFLILLTLWTSVDTMIKSQKANKVAEGSKAEVDKAEPS